MPWREGHDSLLPAIDEPQSKQIVELAMNTQESLRMSIRTKAAHLAFLLSGMFV